MTMRAVLMLAVALATGCASEGSGASSAPVDHAKMMSAAVLRVHWTHTGAAGDLNIRRMTSIDAVAISEPQCSRDAGGSDTAYFDINWRAVKEDASLPNAAISITTAPGRELTVVEPDGRCRLLKDYDLGAVPARTQRVLQLVSSGGSDLRQLIIVLNGHRAMLPLVPACGPSGQPASLSCPIDPESYISGAPFSSDLQLS